MGKIKMLLDTFLPFKQVLKWDRALYEGYFSCSSQKELIRWGKDSDYAGQRTLKLRKENGEILTKRKKIERRESQGISYQNTCQKRRQAGYTVPRRLCHCGLLFFTNLLTSFLIQDKNGTHISWRRRWGERKGGNACTGDMKKLVTIWYTVYNPGPEVTSRTKGTKEGSNTITPDQGVECKKQKGWIRAWVRNPDEVQMSSSRPPPCFHQCGVTIPASWTPRPSHSALHFSLGF